MDNRDESKFFGGSQYIERLDKLLVIFNDANILENVSLMFKIMYNFKNELSPYMTEKESEDIKEKFKIAFNKLKDYMKETESNRKIQQSHRRNPTMRVSYTSTKKTELIFFLCDNIREPLK